MKYIVYCSLILILSLAFQKLSSNELENLGDIEFYNENYREALTIYNKIEPDSINSVLVYNIGFANWMIGNLDKAEICFKDCINEKDFDELSGDAYLALGSINHYRTNYLKSLKCCFRALKIYSKLEIPEKQVQSYMLIANSLYFLPCNNLSKHYINKCYEMLEKIGDSVLKHRFINLEAQLIYKNKLFSVAKNRFLTCLSFYSSKNMKYEQSLVLNNLGLTYYELGEYQKAKESFQKSIELKEKISENWGIANTLINMSELYIKTGDYNDAFDCLQRSKKIINEINAPDKELECDLVFSHLYKALGEYDKAYEHFIRYSSLKDSIFSFDKLETIFELEAAIRSEDSDYEYLELIESYDTLVKHNFEGSMLLGLIVLVFIISATLFILQSRCVYLLIRDSNMKEFYKKRINNPDEAMLEESKYHSQRRYDILHGERYKKPKKKYQNQEKGNPLDTDFYDEMDEPSYGIGNKLEENLILLKSDVLKYSKYLEEKDENVAEGIKGLLNKLQYLLNRIKFSDKDQNQKFTKCRINQIVQKFISMILIHVQEKNIKLDIHLSPDDPMILCNIEAIEDVLINLFVNSSHAIKENGEIKVVTESTESKVFIKFVDNGVGIPKENLDKIWLSFYTTKKHGKGLGLARIKKIISDHNGKISINSKLDQWTEVSIELDRINEK